MESADTPESAALRELLEETGYEAKELISLGFVHPNPAIQNNRCHTFLARNACPVATQNQDAMEDIEVILKPISDVPRLIREGTITHALVIAAFYRYYMEYSEHLSER